MSNSVKIGDDSTCGGCNITPLQDQCVQCFTCNGVFHAICAITNTETHLGSKTMVKTFLAASTKSNFKFFCDECLTILEVNLAKTESQRINGLEKQINKMENQLFEVIKLLKKNVNAPGMKEHRPASIWHDKEKLKTIKAPPPKSVLVIKKDEDHILNEDKQNKVEKTIRDNNISVSKSYQNKEGDTIVVCDDKDNRDKLKNLVSTSNEEITLNAPKEKRSSITIVGLRQEYSKEELLQMLVLQNGFIKGFSSANDIKDHIEINSIRPLRNNSERFQAFVNVTKVFREGLNHFGNKVSIGLGTCKIYDRYYIKRCNNCQHFGHYMKECPTQNAHVCGNCTSNHYTNDCTSSETKCINCVRNGMEKTDHKANSYSCPSFTKNQEIMKKKLGLNTLNLGNPSLIPPR